MRKVDFDVIVDDAAIADQAGKKSDYASLGELPFIEKTMIAYAAKFIIQVQKNLQSTNKVDTGRLERDIQEGSLIKQGGSYSIDVGYPASSEGAKYYDFVNKGVKGFKSGTPNSPYQFRSAYPSMNGPMVNAIQKWVKRNALAHGRLSKEDYPKRDFLTMPLTRSLMSNFITKWRKHWAEM